MAYSVKKLIVGSREAVSYYVACQDRAIEIVVESPNCYKYYNLAKVNYEGEDWIKIDFYKEDKSAKPTRTILIKAIYEEIIYE